jgi:hypothetical protein
LKRAENKSPSQRSAKKPRKARQGDREISGEVSGATPPLVPQPHGGALLAGGRPGHKGGSGRPPNELREAARAGLDEGALERIIGIANGTLKRKGCCPKCGEYIAQEEPTHRESTQATDLLVRLGVGAKIEMETPVSPMDVTLTVGPEVAREWGERKSLAEERRYQS